MLFFVFLTDSEKKIHTLDLYTEILGNRGGGSVLGLRYGFWTATRVANAHLNMSCLKA